MKRIITLSIIFALVLGFTQCKKKAAEPVVNNDLVPVTITVGMGGDKCEFDPTEGKFKWKESEDEYILVGGTQQGYLGSLHGDYNDGGPYKTFGGNLTTPREGEQLYFFYVGDNSLVTTSSETAIMNFENQEGTESSVTKYFIAVSNAVTPPTTGNAGNYGQVTLYPKTSIARFDVSSFKDINTNRPEQKFLLTGTDIQKEAQLNFKTGTVTNTSEVGNLNINISGTGTVDNSNLYVGLVPSTTAATTINIESPQNEGSIVFNQGIQGGKYYVKIEDDTYKSLPVTGSTKIYFTMTNAGVKVRFAKGNLKYSRTSTAADWSTGTWSFMDNQYDYIETGSSVSDDYANETAIGLFAFGSSGAALSPWETGNEAINKSAFVLNDGRTPNAQDWGYNTITNGEGYTWFTPLNFEYVLTGRLSAKKVNYSFLKAIIIGNDNKPHKGLIIFPDLFKVSTEVLSQYTRYMNQSDIVYSVTVNQQHWSIMEAAGAVFLPAAGNRNITSDYETWVKTITLSDVGTAGCYWTGTGNDGDGVPQYPYDGAHYGAYGLVFNASTIYPNKHDNHRRQGYSVRLVRRMSYHF